jgi:hypothetical protein
MESLKLAIVLLAIPKDQMEPLAADGRHAGAPGTDLDARTDFGWHLPDVRGAVAAGFNAVFGRWHSASRAHTGNGQLAQAES